MRATKLSRRDFLKAGVGGTAIITGAGNLTAAPQASSPPAPTLIDTDWILVNGKFVDGRGAVGSSLTIRNGRIVKVGQTLELGPNTRRIDLGGRTVIPGFFDAHVHYTRAGINPGYEARGIERAFS